VVSLQTNRSFLSGPTVVHEVFADGSFVEDKDHPNDIDGYFACDLRELASGELERKLNLPTLTRSAFRQSRRDGKARGIIKIPRAP
jgi:hypothetical protein